MDNSIKLQRDIIALEAFTITSPTKLLSNVFPSMVENFKAFVGKLSGSDKEIKLNSDQKKFIDVLSRINYLDIVGHSLAVPSGFKGQFKDYASELKDASEHVANIEKDLITPYARYLSQLISISNHRFDTSNYFSILESYGREREKIFKDLAKFFDNKSRTESKVGDVLERNADWKSIFEDINSANKNINSVSRPKLIKKVDEVSVALDILVSKIEAKEIDGISPAATRSLGEGVYQVANEIEAFSALYYQIQIFTKIIDQAVTKLSKLGAE